MSDKRNDSPNRQNERRRETPGGGGPVGPRLTRGAFGWVVLLASVVAVWLLVSKSIERRREIDLAQLNIDLYGGGVQSLVIEGNTVKGRWREWYLTAKENAKDSTKDAAKEKERSGRAGETRDAFLVKLHPSYITPQVLDTWAALVRAPDPQNKQGNADGKVIYDDSGSMMMQFVMNFLPWVLILGFIWFVIFRQLRASGGSGGMLNFGKTRARFATKEHVNITFDDVAGIDEAKEEVQEIIEFLKNPRRFQRLGGRIPRGVLLIGEPGCGKTLLAKAIAGEADVPFLSICGSDFVEMFVGVGASRVRDLFKQAKENAPCIVFLDEIDAVGRRRGSGFQSGGDGEREQTLNAILVEMDGLETNEGVIVIAATNRADVLDPALKRPGRFDRQISIPLPDVKGRVEILRVHARNVKLAASVDLERIARGTSGFSGADLAALINESALSAVMANKDAVDQQDLEEARDKLLMGRARHSAVIDEATKRETAYHEAGHTVLMYYLPDGDPLHKVSIIPRGRALGVTANLPEGDRHSLPRKYAVSKLKTLFGGRIAEEMFLNDIDAGAAMDIRQATTIARKMVCEWGMSDSMGFINYVRDSGEGGSGMESYMREHSEATAQAIDAEVRRIIDTSYAEARKLLEEHRSDVQKVAEALLKYETLDRADIEKVLRDETLDHKVPRRARNEPPPLRAASVEPASSSEPSMGVPLPQPGA